MIGIVLLNYNTPEDVFTCVDSIRNKTSAEYKIYIVDNCSTDDSAQRFDSAFKDDGDIVLLSSDANNGFSAGNNIGIKRAVGDGCEFVCIINADVILVNDAISILADKLAADKTVGVAAPIINTVGQEYESQFARNKLTMHNFLAEKTFLKHFKSYCKKHPRYQICNEHFADDYKFMGMTYGCMYVTTAEFFESTGYMDECVFLFNEEDIIAYKLEEKALFTLITPDAVIIHNHHSSIEKTTPAFRKFHFLVSELTVLRKYNGSSWLRLWPIIAVFKMFWLLRCIRHKDYRKMRKRFFRALKDIKAIKPGSGCGLYSQQKTDSPE